MKLQTGTSSEKIVTCQTTRENSKLIEVTLHL